jgi:hypothetical protein
VLGVAVLLAACGGGGGDTAGVGTGGTGSFSVGPITGFGSIFVNGVRYEDNGARLIDDDGNVKVLSGDDNPLRLGMVVEVSGTVDDSGTAGTATQIVVGAEIKGPVTAVDAAAGTFTVFGIPVRTNAATVYEDFGGAPDLAVGNVVEVYGLQDSAGGLLATRVEREARTVAAFIADDGEYRVRGRVAALAGSAPVQRFSVATVAVVTDAATRIDGTLADGAPVSVRLDPTVQGDGRYMAERVQVKSRSYGDDAGGAKGEVEGYVSGFTGAADTFRVAGYPVRLGASVRYEDGVAGDLVDGARIEAEGRIEDGVLVAEKVEFESRDDDEDDGAREFEFEGTAQCIACGAAEGSFTIRGATVVYDGTTRFEDVSGATLNGKTVKAKGLAEVTATGTVYRATKIEADD